MQPSIKYRPRVLLTPLTLTLAIYFIASACYVTLNGVRSIDDTWRGRTDFETFYSSAKVITGPERDWLYKDEPLRWLVQRREFQPPAVGNFFNPPALAYLFWPLRAFDYLTAKVIFFVVSLLSAIGVAGCSLLWKRTVSVVLVSLAVVFSSWATFMNLWMGQPGLTYALVSGIALFALEKNRNTWATPAFAFLALKPTLLLGPVLSCLGRRHWREVSMIAVVASICILAPIALLGVNVLNDYRDLSAKLTENAFTYKDGITIGAFGLMNWNGYIANLFHASPQYSTVLALDVFTILLAVKAAASGTFREAWLAGVAAGLLVVPHVLAYDWVLLIPAAMAVVLERHSRSLVFLLLLVHLGVNLSLYQQTFVWPDGFAPRDLGGYWAVPALESLVFYLAFRTSFDAHLDLLTREAKFRMRAVRTGAE